jgi:hypothetical protein
VGGVKFIEHLGKLILMIDLRRCEFEDIVRIVKETKKLISVEPPASVLALTDVTGAHTSIMVSRVLKEFTTFNKPFIKASAVVGVVGILKVEFELVTKFTGRTFNLFETQDQAKEWLISQ